MRYNRKREAYAPSDFERFHKFRKTKEIENMERNEPCWCGSGKKYKKCHMAMDEKIALHAEKGEIVPDHSMIKTPEQIEKIRISADLNTAVLDHVAAHIHAGMLSLIHI